MVSIYQSKDHRWRDAFNPLRGLSMPRLVSLLEAGERGQYADLQWFYYYMERSDAMIASAIQRRRSALLSVDWDIRLVAGRDEGGKLKPEGGREGREGGDWGMRTGRLLLVPVTPWQEWRGVRDRGLE